MIMMEHNDKFDREDMRGYGYAAYCAGWKAALYAINSPMSGTSCAQAWLNENEPTNLGEPNWRVKPAQLHAPDLLAALEGLVDVVGDPCGGDASTALSDARAAIRKAKGEV